MKRGVEKLVLATMPEGDKTYACIAASFHGNHCTALGDDGLYSAHEMNSASYNVGSLAISLSHDLLPHEHLSSKQRLGLPTFAGVEFKVMQDKPGYYGEVIVGARNDNPEVLEKLAVAANEWRVNRSHPYTVDKLVRHIETSFPCGYIDNLAFIAPHLNVIAGYPVVQAAMRARYGFWDISSEHLKHPGIKDRLMGVEIFNGTLPQGSNLRSVELAKQFPNAAPLANPDSHYVDGVNTALTLVKVQLDRAGDITTGAAACIAAVGRSTARPSRSSRGARG
jgi:hypothetical protein